MLSLVLRVDIDKQIYLYMCMCIVKHMYVSVSIPVRCLMPNLLRAGRLVSAATKKPLPFLQERDVAVAEASGLKVALMKLAQCTLYAISGTLPTWP